MNVRHSTGSDNPGDLLAEIRSVIQTDLADAEKFSIKALDSDIPLIQEIGRHFHQYGGKKTSTHHGHFERTCIGI